MSPTGSVTAWIGQLQAGEETALERLHQRYWPALVTLARQRLKGVPGRAADEEDVAQEAFWGFYRSLRAGRVPRLRDRHDLLALLTHIIACKAINQIKHEFGTQKRGTDQRHDEQILDTLAGREQSEGNPGLARSSEPSPLDQAILNDWYQYYLKRLPENLREFAELYLAGCTHKETAELLGCSLRSVERKIALILERWRGMAAENVKEEMNFANKL